MIELTPTESLYPIRIPPGPTLRWRRTVVALILLAVVRFFILRQKKRVPPTFHPDVQEMVPGLDIALRLHQLQEINTSVRTPEQKAKALLIHLLLYVWIEDHELHGESYTLTQIQHMPNTEKIIPSLTHIYEIIYMEKKITHSTINSIVKNINTSLTWN